MTIRPTNASPTSPVGPVSADAAGSKEAAASDARAAAAPDGGDRVELSATARAKAEAGAGADRPEIETARHALRAEDTLSPARLHELRQKARSGHYDAPDVVARIADAATRDLAPPTDTE